MGTSLQNVYKYIGHQQKKKKNSLALLLSLISMNNNVFLTLKEFSTSILYKGIRPLYYNTHSMSRLMSRSRVERNNAKEICVVKLPMFYIKQSSFIAHDSHRHQDGSIFVLFCFVCRTLCFFLDYFVPKIKSFSFNFVSKRKFFIPKGNEQNKQQLYFSSLTLLFCN